MKTFIKDAGVIIASTIGGILLVGFSVYALIALMGWFFSDPFNIIPNEEKCKYEVIGRFKCVTK